MRSGESFIEQPVRSLQTMLRTLAQDDRRYTTVIPDGIYGPTTTQAVSVFQRQNDLPVTGTADQTTWETIVAAYDEAEIRIGKAEPIEILLDPSETLKSGDSGAYVYLLQSLLIYLSEEHTAIRRPEHTGVFDKNTSIALKDFQELAELEPTGELDRKSWRYLARHFTASAHHRDRVVKPLVIAE